MGLYAALSEIVDGDLTESERKSAEDRVVKSVCGTAHKSAPPADDIRELLRMIPGMFGELRNDRHREEALDCLVRAHLADHQATEEEVNMLQMHFAEAAARVASIDLCAKEVIVARSEMYTTKRQAVEIRDRVVATLTELGFAAVLE